MMTETVIDLMRAQNQETQPLPFDAIAIGTGPSFYPWLRSEIPNVPKYGAGASGKCLRLDAYCIGDLMHERHMQLGVTTYASATVFGLLPQEDWIHLYDQFGNSHGGSSGGMALSMACVFHRRVALIGFDGGMSGNADGNFHTLLSEWKDKGRTFVSLMPPGTPWDSLMEQP